MSYLIAASLVVTFIKDLSCSFAGMAYLHDKNVFHRNLKSSNGTYVRTSVSILFLLVMREFFCLGTPSAGCVGTYVRGTWYVVRRFSQCARASAACMLYTLNRVSNVFIACK